MLFHTTLALAQRPTITITEPKSGDKFSLLNPRMQVHFKVENVDNFSSVGLFLWKNVPESEKAAHPGPEGAIISAAIDSSQFSYPYNWGIKSMACMYQGGTGVCDTVIPPGAYRIEAVLYNKRELSLIGPNAPKTEDILAQTYSGEFKIEADPSEIIIKRLDEAAIYKYNKLAEVDEFPGMTMAPYLMTGAALKNGKDGTSCKKYTPIPPYNGSILACTKGVDGAIQVGGKIVPDPGVIIFDKAKAKVISTLTQKYGGRTDFIKQPTSAQVKDPSMMNEVSYLGMDFLGWNYEVKKWWTFFVRVHSVGGNKTRDKFDEMVTLLVGDEGWVCITNTIDYRPNAKIEFKKLMTGCR